jgi:membrane protein
MDRLIEWIDAQQQRRPALAFGVAVVRKFSDDGASKLAALVAYYSFFAIFPLLVVFTIVVDDVLGSDPARRQELLDSALANFPVIEDQIRADPATRSGDGIALVVSLLVALWGGLGAIGSMQHALNSVWDLPRRDRPNFVTERIRSVAMLAVLGLVIVAGAAANSVAAGIGEVAPVGRIVAIGLALAVNVALFALSFRVLVNRTLSWSDVWPGALFAGVSLTAFQSFGGAYIDRVVDGSPAFGTFAVVLGLLAALALQAQITLLAAELNVVRHGGLSPRSLGPDLTRADREALVLSARTELRRPGQTIDVAVDRQAIGDDHDAGSRRPEIGV